jgi:hypothetical protein
MTPQQALEHLYRAALEAPFPSKVHNISHEAMLLLKKLIEEKKEQ